MSESITTTPAEGTIASRRRDEARISKPDGDLPIAARTDGASPAGDEPTPADDAEPRATGAGRAPRWMHVGRLLLAPVLATAAVGVHWAINVPAHVSVSAKDQGAKKEGKAKKPPRKKANAVKPRPPGEITATWKRYEATEFTEEPVRSQWIRGAQSLVNKTVVVARKHAFAGAPEEPRVSVLDVTCKTIRCRFVLRSPFVHEIDLVVAALEDVQIDGESIWLGFTHERIAPPKENLPKDETYEQVTIAFTADDLDDGDMKVADEDAIAGGAADTEDDMPE